jgi:fumarate reductase flavoprotein subunit
MVAAIRLAEQGVDCVVLERGPKDGGDGNARISGGLLHVAWRAMDDDPEKLYEAILEETDGEADPSLARALADNANDAMNWLTARGAEIRPKSDLAYMKYAMYPHTIGVGSRHIEGRGPDRTMRALYDLARSLGVEVRSSASATSMTRSGRTWHVGVDLPTGHTSYEAHAVLIADGGFQASPELLTRYVGPSADRAFLRASLASTGTGLRMLLAAGASALGLGRVYGHVVSTGAFQTDELWPYPSVDKLCLQGLLVDRNGNRHVTHAKTGVQLVNELARTEDPRGFFLVCDQTLWDDAGADNPYGTKVPNPDLVRLGGHHVQDAEIAGVAAALNVDSDALMESVQAHNADGKKPKVGQGPFHAMAVVPGITFTMGGARTDEISRVLDEIGVPIEGLYAAGSCTGGLHGGPRGGYVGGLAVALVFGYLAGAAIGDELVHRGQTATGRDEGVEEACMATAEH